MDTAMRTSLDIMRKSMSIDPYFASSVRAYRGIVEGPTSTQKQIFFEKHGQDNGSPNIYVFSHERRVDCDARGGQDTDIDGLAEVDRAGPWLNAVSYIDAVSCTCAAHFIEFATHSNHMQSSSFRPPEGRMRMSDIDRYRFNTRGDSVLCIYCAVPRTPEW